MVEDGAAGVRSVELAIDVLEAVAFSGEEMGVTQIADRLSVTKGSVHRHLHTLVERGYLTQNGDEPLCDRSQEPLAGTFGARHRSCAGCGGTDA